MSGERQQVTHGGAYPAGGGYPRSDDDDFRGAAEHASRHAGSSGDSDLFSSLLGALTQKKQSLAEEDVDEDDAVKQHKRFFERDDNDDNDNEADDKSLGSAAAMQALKLFTSGQSESAHESSSQSAFVGLAMAEASKLFDQKASQGKVSSDSSKESAVMKAGEMALKMYLKSQGGGKAQSSGSGILGLASKFLA
ncbi:beta-flanking protein [Daldinia childiae]|uniref:beta-flanking protein n=1 Tax=Daldinia childiae TaxID=326645 RepID=UPI0014470178|nr:beta-flanking protein [Daldinia childiae]KAF3057285.1 beta-flanking protein [Daldinia childiae]